MRQKKRRHRNTKRRPQCEDGDRDWSDAVKSQGTPMHANQDMPPRARRGKEQILLQKECGPAHTIISDFWSLAL